MPEGGGGRGVKPAYSRNQRTAERDSKRGRGGVRYVEPQAKGCGGIGLEFGGGVCVCSGRSEGGGGAVRGLGP